MKRIFCFDVDGTTLQKGETVFSKEILDIFNKIKNENDGLIVASGRTYRNLSFLFSNDKKIVYICENGNLLIYNDKVLLEKSFDQKYIRNLINNIKNNFPLYHIEVCTAFKTYCLTSDESYRTWFSKMCQVELCAVCSIDDIKENIIKVSFYKEKQDDLFYKYLESIRLLYGKDINIFDANNSWIDLSPKNSTKGETLERFLNQYLLYNLPLYVFGDGENDISMLKLTNNSYSPDSALEEVKNISKHIYSNISEAVDLIYKKS